MITDSPWVATTCPVTVQTYNGTEQGELMTHPQKLQPCQHPYGHMTVIQMLGNWPSQLLQHPTVM